MNLLRTLPGGRLRRRNDPVLQLTLGHPVRLEHLL